MTSIRAARKREVPTPPFLPSGAWVETRSMNPGGDAAPRVEQRAPDYFADLLSRRQVLQRATVLGLGGMGVSAPPVDERLLVSVDPAQPDDLLADPTLQAYADTLIPGRKALLTDLGK